jgi:hypothetical protein
MPWRPLEITRQQRGFRWVLPRGFYISRSAAVGGAPAAFTFEPAGAINKHVRVIGVAGAGIPQRDEEHHCDEHNRQYLLLSYRLTAQSARGKLQLLGCHACCAVERAKWIYHGNLANQRTTVGLYYSL